MSSGADALLVRPDLCIVTKMNTVAMSMVSLWVTLMVSPGVETITYHLGDTTSKYPSYCICQETNRKSNTTSIVFERDSLDRTVPQTAYTILSIAFSINSNLGYCVTEYLQRGHFPSFKPLATNNTTILTRQDMFGAVALLHFPSLTYTDACIAYLLVPF
ncbi:uncharacterized protein LOC117337935 isoform X2 [Pecten maximus]|uniref:uncharacterized protein LOC117337935 isoform X2 n=1 Tax=Pecten maximus TaxID=6579 RepID=UPI0014580200|nr:uncharacterized protein LOC117337935 isoform X2 [Pecten maximus]